MFELMLFIMIGVSIKAPWWYYLILSLHFVTEMARQKDLSELSNHRKWWK